MFPILRLLFFASPPMCLNGVNMSKNQESTLKVSNETLRSMKLLKAELNFKSYDALIATMIGMMLNEN